MYKVGGGFASMKMTKKYISKYAEHVSMYKVGGCAGADGVSRES